MRLNSEIKRTFLKYSVFCFLLFSFCLMPEILRGLTVIGQVQSLYRERASVKIFEIVGTGSETAPVKVGQFVSFTIPKVSRNRRSEEIKFGNIVVADLTGNVATEYADNTENASASLMIWNAVRVERVKNAKKYDGAIDSKGKDGEVGEERGKGKHGKGKGRKHEKQKEEEDAPQIWTQEETVRGKVDFNVLKIYIREDGLRPKDTGLEVLNSDWREKLKPYLGRKVVLSGTTHRVSLASGTFDIKSIIKIYPKD
ncbi:MAG: hypothetical protein HQM08_15680 [Candidatus Riflebacteria bacterium]|nr:hypothetical protein [Candidatus Riflebacteria bacterium]